MVRGSVKWGIAVLTNTSRELYIENGGMEKLLNKPLLDVDQGQP
jgi:hypothetical protein